MAEKIRYTRKDLKGPDEFISTFGRVVGWCKENRSRLTTALVVVLAVLVVSAGANAYLRWQERKAGGEIWPFLDEAREVLSSPEGIDPASLVAMERSIEAVAAKYSRTRAALYAKYYLGCMAFRRGDYDASAARFKEAIDGGKAKGVLQHLLHKGLASSLEAKGDYAAAAAAYRDAAESAGPRMRSMAKFGEGRALELAGKKTEAVSVYRRILEENPETRQKDLIDIKTTRME